ncbi:MAG: DUF308 domain-containing protein [Leucobacter sp.]
MSQQPVPYSGASAPRSPLPTLIVTAILLIAVGVGFLVWPFFAATWMLAILVGSAFITTGLAMLTRAAASPAALIGGLLLLAVGVLAILFSEFTVTVLVTFVGFGLVMFGVLWTAIGASFARRSPAAVVPGIVMLVGGVLALIWPNVALIVAAVVCGICMILLGGLLVWAATRMRRVDPSKTTIVI